MKKMGNCVFSKYFNDCIKRELLKDPGTYVTSIDVDIPISEIRDGKEQNIVRMKSIWHYKSH